MFGSLGVWEIGFILVLALLLFGPKKLPEIGRQIGKGLGEFRRASNELKRQINTELSFEDEAPQRSRPQPVRTPPAIAASAVAAEPAPPASETPPETVPTAGAASGEGDPAHA